MVLVCSPAVGIAGSRRRKSITIVAIVIAFDVILIELRSANLGWFDQRLALHGWLNTSTATAVEHECIDERMRCGG